MTFIGVKIRLLQGVFVCQIQCNICEVQRTVQIKLECSKKFSNMVVWLFEDQWNIINFFFPGSHVFIIIVTIDLHVFYFDRKSLFV